MAEGGVSEPGLEETPKESQECPICFSEFKDPRMLDCSHRFCLKCLQELKQAQNKEDKNIVCPLCRSETVLPEDGVDMLPRVQDGQGLRVMCQACDDENKAISRCMDCEHYLCQECQTAHQRWAALRSHKITTLRELGSDGELRDYVPKCEEHPDQDVDLYCFTCETPICKTCIDSKHKPPLHFHGSIDEADDDCRQEIEAAVFQAENCIQDSNPVLIDHSLHRLATMLTQTKIQISLTAKKEIAKITQKENQLKQQAQNMFAKREKAFTYAKTVKQTVSKVNQFMASASSYGLLESKVKFIQKLREEVEAHESYDHQKSFLGFKESQDPGVLGTLLVDEKWRHKQTFKSTGNCLAVYSTREIVVAGRDGFSIFDATGEVYTKSSTGYKPTALAVNSDDQLIMLDSPTVKILNEEYQLLREFTPGKEAGIDSEPTCLAVDDSNLIAVGYKDEDKISLHNADGSLVRTLPAPKIGRNLTISNQQLIYMTTWNSGPKAIDFRGEEIWADDKHFPGGALSCDRAGDIYVATKKNILHYNAHGGKMSNWSCHVNNPRDIKFSASGGHLLVLGDNGLHLFRTI